MKSTTEGGAVLAALRNEIAFCKRRWKRGQTGVYAKLCHLVRAHEIAKQALAKHRVAVSAARKTGGQ